MGKFLKECIIFSSLALFIITIIGNNEMYEAYKCHKTTDWERFSPVYCQDEQFDLLIFGSSHVALLPVHLNENYPIKVKSFNNPGGGLKIQQTYLKYFVNQNNQSNQILYFIDPFMLYSDKWDSANHLRKDRFNAPFFVQLTKNMGLSFGMDYLTSFECFGEFKEKENNPRTEIDTMELKLRLDDLYSNHRTVIDKDVSKQKAELIETIDFLKEQDLLDKLTFCVLPTLLGPEEPLKVELQDFLVELKATYNIPHFNFADIYYHPDTFKYFDDHDHLNEEGTKAFVKNHLLSIIDKELLFDIVQ